MASAGSVTKVEVLRKSNFATNGPAGALGDALLEGDWEAEGLSDGELLDEGDTLAEGEREGEMDDDGLKLGEADELGEMDELGETEALGDKLGEADEETDESPLISSKPTRVAFAAERVNDALALLPAAS